jgi:hypothetical protein
LPVKTTSTVRGAHLALPIALLLLAMLSTARLERASAAETIAVYQAQVPVKLDGVVSPGEWSDAQTTNITTADMGVAFKHNSTGILFLLQWDQSPSICSDPYCYGGIELGYLNNTGPMGATSTPTVMLLLSPSFKGGYDEFISKAEATPASAESDGYKTQSTCALKLSGTTYTAECYRPFNLSNASPYDPMPSLAAGSSLEIAFAVGEFNAPGLHAATDMSSYVLALSNQTYTASTSAGSSSSETASSTGSTSSSVSTTVTSATTYYEELAVIVVGFSVLMLVAVGKYRRG